MATLTWNGANGSFVNGANWTPSASPQSGDTANITAAGTYKVVVNALDSLLGLATITENAASATLEIDGTLGGGLQLQSGTLLVTDFGHASVNGPQTFSGGTLNFIGGSTGFGFIDADSNLTLGTALQVYSSGYAQISGRYVGLQLINRSMITIGGTGTPGYGSLLYVSFDTVVNTGVVNVGSAGEYAVYASNYSEGGQVHVAGGGKLFLASASSRPTFTGAGVITLDSGAVLQGTLGANFAAIAATLSVTSWHLAAGAVIDLQGPINNVGMSATLGVGAGLFGTTVIEGIVTGGLISSGPGLTVNGTLSGVTVQGGVGGNLTDDRSTFLATDGVSRGTLGVIGTSARISFTNATTLDNVYVPQAGTYDDFAAVDATSTVTFGRNATLELSGTSGQFYFDQGTFANLGTFLGHSNSGIVSLQSNAFTNAATGLISLSNNQSFDDQSTFRNAGTILVTSGAKFIAPVSTISFQNTGSMVIDNATAMINSMVTGGGTFTIADGGLLSVQKGFDPFSPAETLIFGAGTGNALAYGSVSAATPTVTNFGIGDEIDLLNFDSSTFVATANSITVGTGATAATIVFAAPLPAGATLSVRDVAVSHTTVITTTACYAAGTKLLTDAGECPIERLREGDRLVTLRGRHGLAPVLWIGRQTIEIARHPRPAAVRPIRVRAGAFGPGVPHRDVRLSPDHAVFIDGALVPIRLLVDGAAITVMDVARIIYLHVELGDHDIILAEGMPAESWLDTGNRAMFANAAAPVLHPDFTPDPATSAARACADFVSGGPRLTAIRNRLTTCDGSTLIQRRR